MQSRRALERNCRLQVREEAAIISKLNEGDGQVELGKDMIISAQRTYDEYADLVALGCDKFQPLRSRSD